jgi:hypothetical protein
MPLPIGSQNGEMPLVTMEMVGEPSAFRGVSNGLDAVADEPGVLVDGMVPEGVLEEPPPGSVVQDASRRESGSAVAASNRGRRRSRPRGVRIGEILR